MDNKDHFKINIQVTITVDRVPEARPVSPAGIGRTPVDSSVIRSVGFQHTAGYRGTLEVEFASGRVYQYFRVPQGVYDDLIEAPSVGAYFSRYIRNSYTAREITDAR